jgi:hypothetical protein
MSQRWSTVRQRGGKSAPGLDASRLIVVGFLIAALLGLVMGLGWMSCQLVRT